MQLHIAYPGMTQTAMLDAMDARTRSLIDELPGITIYPSEQVGQPQPCVLLNSSATAESAATPLHLPSHARRESLTVWQLPTGWHVHIQVARLMVKGMEQGRYVLRFPDVLSTWICAGLGGTSALCLPVIMTAFIAPLVVRPVCRLIS